MDKNTRIRMNTRRALEDLARDIKPEEVVKDHITRFFTYSTDDLQKKIESMDYIDDRKDSLDKLKTINESMMGYIFIAAMRPKEEESYLNLSERKYREAIKVYEDVKSNYHQITAHARNIPQMHITSASKEYSEVTESLRWVALVNRLNKSYISLIRGVKYRLDHLKYKDNLPTPKKVMDEFDIANNTSKTIDELFRKI